jgi:hypothetical protein
MDRRRFLKYAVAGVAVAGSALAGYEFDTWQNSTIRPLVPTVTETQTLRETTTDTVKLTSVYGRLFFDYNGNGVQDEGEPAVVGASIQLKDDTGNVIAEAVLRFLFVATATVAAPISTSKLRYGPDTGNSSTGAGPG